MTRYGCLAIVAAAGFTLVPCAIIGHVLCERDRALEALAHAEAREGRCQRVLHESNERIGRERVRVLRHLAFDEEQRGLSSARYGTALLSRSDASRKIDGR